MSWTWALLNKEILNQRLNEWIIKTPTKLWRVFWDEKLIVKFFLKKNAFYRLSCSAMCLIITITIKHVDKTLHLSQWEGSLKSSLTRAHFNKKNHPLKSNRNPPVQNPRCLKHNEKFALQKLLSLKMFFF